MNPGMIAGAGTGTFEMEAASGVYTELQAGSYIFMDADYARNRKADGGPFDEAEDLRAIDSLEVTILQDHVDEPAAIRAESG